MAWSWAHSPPEQLPQASFSTERAFWIANQSANTVTKLRASDGTIEAMYDVGSDPVFVTFDGRNIWTTNFLSNNVTKLWSSDGTILGTFNVGTGPQGICFDGVHIWVSN